MTRPLRFCMITTFYPPYSFGGDAVYVQKLANALAERGHHVEVIHCLDSYNLLAQGEVPRAATEHPNITIHRLHSPWGTLSPLATQQTGYPFFKYTEIEKILAQGFDVIHYHNISLVGGPKLLELGDAIKLYTTHEYWLVCPMNVLFRYDGVACEETRCLRCTLAYHRPPQWWRYSNMLRDSLKHVDMLIHPSEFCLEKHRAMGIQAPQTILYYLETMPASEKQTPRRQTDQLPYFLYTGRLEFLKGAHTLIPVFKDYPRARLVISGEGSQLAELKALAEGSPNIEFTGWLNHSELQNYYREATALIIPSLCFEAGPLVISEAFGHHIPVIGRALGSLPNMLQEHQGGLTYTDDATLRQALDRMLDKPAWRDEMGERAYAASRKLFTTEAHLDGYFGIIAGVREKKGLTGAE